MSREISRRDFLTKTALATCALSTASLPAELAVPRIPLKRRTEPKRVVVVGVIATMPNPIRQEVLTLLAELSEAAPEVRLGQLIVNLSYLARGLSPESAWDMEDDELLDVAREHLEQWRAKRGVTVGTQ